MTEAVANLSEQTSDLICAGFDYSGFIVLKSASVLFFNKLLSLRWHIVLFYKF